MGGEQFRKALAKELWKKLADSTVAEERTEERWCGIASWFHLENDTRRTTRSGLQRRGSETVQGLSPSIHAYCSSDTPEFVILPFSLSLLASSTLFSQMRIYQTSSISPPLELRILLKVNLPSCLSSLYESLTTSLKGKMSLTWTTEFMGLAMERGEERVNARKALEMGWRCYQKGWSHLSLGLDDIFTQNGLFLSIPQHAHRPPTTPSPVPSPDSFRLRFIDASYKFLHPSIPTPSVLRSCVFHIIHLTFSFCAVWNSAANAIDVRRRVRAPVAVVQCLPSSQ
ncbi:uncharacterized protein LACBIDRAFT_322390 [Laccaria bicolor S238N-H82]|nr:uncharacterized protein LACBIDRAFT_322390 [Laccaria bicolor S238N-H82]EDR13003.1 predicted protein [Laccaria bicolor S238N-H82]|eukprot:XP_001875501.1 predicted protein [Laccaria bicolor S238N-H82]